LGYEAFVVMQTTAARSPGARSREALWGVIPASGQALEDDNYAHRLWCPARKEDGVISVLGYRRFTGGPAATATPSFPTPTQSREQPDRAAGDQA
jgi:hypothetical protein